MGREASALNGYLLEQLKASAKNLYGEYEQDEDAPLPTGWTRVSIGEIAEMVCRGITPKYSVDSDEFVLGQTCIRDNLVLVENSRAHSPKKVTEKWLHKYDLLINSTGVGSLGRTAQIWFEPSKLVVDSYVTIVRTAKPSHALYLGFWAFGHEKFIESLHTGSTGQTELPREHVKAISVVLPDDKTLAAFNTMASPSVELIAANQEENKRLVALRDALLPKLMSGKIDVSEVDITQLNSHLAELWLREKWSQGLTMVVKSLSRPLPHAIFSVARNHPASSSGVLVQLEENHQETAWVKEATSTLWAKSAGTPWGMSHTLRANSTASFSEK